jgi:hypothetical protein
VGTLIPVSYAPFEAAKLASLLIALAAVVTGHLAISRGGGLRRWLIGALFVYPLAGLFVLRFGPVTRCLSQLIPFYWEVTHFSLPAAPAIFILVHLVAGFRRVRATGGVIWRPALGAMLGYFNIVLIGLLFVSLYSKGRHNLDMAVCANNLKRVHYALREYANESRGSFYPPLSTQSGVLMFPPEGIPQKEDIGAALTCPTIRYAKQPTTGPASPFDDQSYFYLGYAVLDDGDVEAFAQAYRKRLAEVERIDGATFNEDLVVVETGGRTRVLHRLREGVEGVLIGEGAAPGSDVAASTRGQDEIPVLIERDLGHIHTEYIEGPADRMRGAKVLYLSGDVRFVPRGTWPMTEKTQRILAELAEQ